MKKKFIVLSIVTLILLGIIITKENNRNVYEKSYFAQGQEQYYVLKSYKGRMAVFEGNSDIPEEIFDIFVSSLPEADQRQLNSGIYAVNPDELYKIIEEYSS